MSEENVEIVRRLYAEWEKGNFSPSEAFDPRVRVTWVDPMLAQRSETIGLRETNRTMRDFLETYERLTATAERIIDAGDSVVVVVASWLAAAGRRAWSSPNVRGASGPFRREGERVVNYRDPAEAFAAAGLSE